MTTKPRFRELYDKEILPKLKEELGSSNVMAVPRLTKITINIGIGEAKSDIKLLDEAMATLTTLAGQKAPSAAPGSPSRTSSSARGHPIGAMVTLRGDRMYEFLDRLSRLAIPRMRDFKGLSDRSFDGQGNFTLGVKDQLIFPEVDYNKVTRAMGMNITIGPPPSGTPTRRPSLSPSACPSGSRRARMASTRGFAKMAKKPKFAVRYRNRCKVAAGPRATTASSPSAVAASGCSP